MRYDTRRLATGPRKARPVDDRPTYDELHALLVKALAENAELVEARDKLAAVVWGKINSRPLDPAVPNMPNVKGQPALQKICQMCGGDAAGGVVYFGVTFCNNCSGTVAAGQNDHELRERARLVMKQGPRFGKIGQATQPPPPLHPAGRDAEETTVLAKAMLKRYK